MTNLIVQTALVAAIVLFVAASVYLRGIYAMLCPGRIRKAWLGLATLLIVIVAGCIAFLGVNVVEGPNHHEDWLIALSFLASAGFVFTVCVLARSSTKDAARIADLERAAYFDPLTQLYTRGKIMSLLEAECVKSRRDTVAVSVMMLDMDDFKFINDCFGHQAGDSVLKQIAQVLLDTRGNLNFVGRYGGEEFIVVLPNTLPFQAAEVAERIRSAVAEKLFTFDEETFTLTMSIGVATSMTFRETCDDLIASADRALYMAKLAGRNKALHAEDFTVKKSVARVEAPSRSIRLLPEKEP